MKKIKNIRKLDEYLRMTPYSACATIEQFEGDIPTQKEIASAWQYIWDTGLWKNMQGFYGRTVHDLVEGGMIES